jgi:hypothetical protein
MPHTVAETLDRGRGGSGGKMTVSFRDLPGQDLIAAGLDDLQHGIVSVPALLVSIGAPRLAVLGVTLPRTLPNAEHALYERLHQEHADGAHSRYNALLARLVSFERALACAR